MIQDHPHMQQNGMQRNRVTLQQLGPPPNQRPPMLMGMGTGVLVSMPPGPALITTTSIPQQPQRNQPPVYHHYESVPPVPCPEAEAVTITDGPPQNVPPQTAPQQQQQPQNHANTNTSSAPNATLANIKEKTPMCLVNELARYNKIQHQYRLTGEEGPAHKKIFTVTLKLGSEEYEAEGPSIKKAQHLAAAQALAKTELKHPPPKTIRNRGQGQGRVSNPGAVTPTVELNALAMRRGERTTYVIENGNPNSQHQFIPQPPYFQTRYNYNMQQSQPRFDGRRNIRPGHYGYQDNRYYNQYRPGAPHNPGEAITVRLKVGEREYPGQGYSVQAARHDAASKAIEHIKQLGGGQENTTEPQPSSSTAAPAPASAPAPTNVTENASTNTNNNNSSSVTTASEPNNNNNNNNAVNINSNGIDLKSPISLVYEIALKRNLNVTFEVLSEKGPPHMKVFVTQCRVGTFQAEGEGNGKKISKKRAAEKMLEELLKLPPMSSLQNLQNPMKRKRVPTKKKTRNLIKVNVDKTVEVTEEINPISRLIQIQQAKKEREPTYEVIEERGAPRRREFVIEASVNGVAYRGVGPNKKIAKRNAAEGLLALLGYGNNNNSTNTKSALKSDKENGEPAPEKGRKVTFVEEKQGEAAATATANNATSSTTTNNSVSNTNQTQSVGGSGGRQLVPGVLLVTEQSAAFPKKENDKTEKPVQNQIKPPSTPVQGVRSKDQLLYLAQLMEIQVQFSDFPKANHETYLTLVSLSTNPPQVCHGEGPTTEASHEKAALEALRVLSELGLDNVVPNKDTSNGSASGESSTTTSPKGNNINQNGVKK